MTQSKHVLKNRYVDKQHSFYLHIVRRRWGGWRTDGGAIIVDSAVYIRRKYNLNEISKRNVNSN